MLLQCYLAHAIEQSAKENTLTYERRNRNVYKKFCEELIAYFPSIPHGPHKKRRVQQFFYCWCICCRGNVFTEPLPCNDRRDKHTDTQIDGRGL
jgi:hypothetical protein